MMASSRLYMGLLATYRYFESLVHICLNVGSKKVPNEVVKILVTSLLNLIS